MLELLFNKRRTKNITYKINNIHDFKTYILQSRDDEKYYYIIIDEIKYINGLFITHIFEKIGISNIYMIIINKGLFHVIKKFNISNEFNIQLFDNFFKFEETKL
jgi:hypothetical protein